MKMGLNDISAHDVINSFNQASLNKIFNFLERRQSLNILQKK